MQKAIHRFSDDEILYYNFLLA